MCAWPRRVCAQVPKGHVWLEGDNLIVSRDSREYGPVPLALIKGRAVLQVRGAAGVWGGVGVWGGPAAAEVPGCRQPPLLTCAAARTTTCHCAAADLAGGQAHPARPLALSVASLPDLGGMGGGGGVCDAGRRCNMRQPGRCVVVVHLLGSCRVMMHPADSMCGGGVRGTRTAGRRRWL
jgi:hypothetical protein